MFYLIKYYGIFGEPPDEFKVNNLNRFIVTCCVYANKLKCMKKHNSLQYSDNLHQ